MALLLVDADATIRKLAMNLYKFESVYFVVSVFNLFSLLISYMIQTYPQNQLRLNDRLDPEVKKILCIFF